MLKVYRAEKTNKLTQGFDGNIPCAKLDANGYPIRPFIIVNGTDNFTCPVGYTKLYPAVGLISHGGYDWALWRGEPIYFNVVDGNLNKIKGRAYTEIDKDGGKGVDVVFQDPDTKEWFKIRYWHLLEQKIYDGQEVESGQLLGLGDSTGASSGDHEHEGFKPLNSSTKEDLKFPNNGWYGGVDIAKYPNIIYYPSDFILDILNLKQQLTLLQQLVKLYNLLIQAFKK